MSDIHTFVAINADASVPPLFSVIDDALGSCDDNLDFRLQGELKDAFHKHCNRMGRPMGERLRELIAMDTFGQAHIASLVAQRLAVLGINASDVAQSDVQTSAH